MSLRWWVLVCVLTTLGAWMARGSPTSQESVTDPVVMTLLRDLKDPDPATRANAAEALRKLDERARPAVVAASRSEDLTLASAAADLLISMPWYRRNDPQAMRLALRQYGQRDEVQRIEGVGRIASEYPRAIANQILPRLLMEEPSEDVCWHIVAALRRSAGPQTARALRAIDPGTNRASALVAVARAWLNADPARAREMLRRAVEVEASAPSYDDGEMDFAFDLLAADHEAAGRFDAAARLRRQQSSRIGLLRDSYGMPVFELFALHGRYGPLDGLAQDVQTYCIYLGQPQVLYALSAVYERGGDGLSAAVCRGAASASTLRAPQRLRIAEFLARNGWRAWSQRELLTIVSTASESPEAAVLHVNARMRLAELARDVDDDAQAAEHLGAALRLIETNAMKLNRVSDSGHEAPLDPADLRGEIAWLELRQARHAGDTASVERHLAQLLLLKPSVSRVVVDVVPYLKSRGREADAQTLFSAAYAVHRSHLDAAPGDLTMMNELAWLCARSGERLDEALELAGRVVAAAPAEPAYLDTAAEANFQVGRIQEAMRLERAALQLRPADPFLQEQLERFEQAARAASTRPAARP